MTAAIRDLTRPLLGFWVCDEMLFAAEDAAQALAVAQEVAPGLEPYTLDDVREALPAELYEMVLDEQGRRWTLRGLLHAKTEPGYVAGYEH
jgi:hypothetical protein